MDKRRSVVCGWVLLLVIVCVSAETFGAEAGRSFRAGAAAVDITPQEFPVEVAGSFFWVTASEVKDRLHARCLVLDNGQERVAIVLVDNCILPRDLIEEAKRLAGEATGMATDRMLISATHTHSGPTVVNVLGSVANEKYRQGLPGQIAQAVRAAVSNLGPARIGWTVVEDAEHTHCRRWIRRPDRIDVDPFGRRSIRAMMHPGYQNPDFLGPSGPVDVDLSVVSVQSPEGRPLAVLANYSMHYVGAKPLSADYFGAFADKLAELYKAGDSDPPFVGIMSNGTSGDQHWMNYKQPKPARPLDHVEYGEVIAREVFEACRKIEYRDWVPLVISERLLSLEVRPISDQDLARAREMDAELKDRKPSTLPELYARQQVQMSQMPSTHELKLQAVRIGDLGIAAIPCEVFGITGLKIKAHSPLKPTFTIELANGYDGYIPPPGQHDLGGYTTWRAPSACLEVEAEPKIAAVVLELLEEVSGKSRRVLTGEDYPFGDYPRLVLAAKPRAYWRLNEFCGPQAADASGNGNQGIYEPGVAFYLEGPAVSGGGGEKGINRAAHLAGGLIRAQVKGIEDRYTVEMWFNNYLPIDVRPVTGYLFSCNAGGGAWGDSIRIGGKDAGAGKLLFEPGGAADGAVSGKTEIEPRTWYHITVVRDGRKIAVYLNGETTAEMLTEAEVVDSSRAREVFIGGGSDRTATFEGRIDEVAIYDRPLSAEEVASHYAAVAGRSRDGKSASE